jgi:hypothetical protein
MRKREENEGRRGTLFNRAFRSCFYSSYIGGAGLAEDANNLKMSGVFWRVLTIDVVVQKYFQETPPSLLTSTKV